MKMKKMKKARMKMMAMAKMALMALLLTTLTACNRQSSAKSFKAERAQREYQAAMRELAAGRVKAAGMGLQQAIRADPRNSSAHFQLACLLQDRLHDYSGAIGEYRVFLLLFPTSEKAELAESRIERCEQLLRERLLRDDAEKFAGALKSDNERLSQALSEANSRQERLQAELASAQEKVASVRKENERLRQLMESLADDAEAPQQELVDARQLLEEEDPKESAALAEAKLLAAESEAEDLAAGTKAPLLDTSRSTAVTNAPSKAESDRQLPPRPDEYVVQKGDSLYKIANRFYGKTSAWKNIREANKDKISTDGRIRAGQKIKLP